MSIAGLFPISYIRSQYAPLFPPAENKQTWVKRKQLKRFRRPDGLPTVDFPIPTPSRRRVPTCGALPTPRRAPDRRFSYPDAFPTSGLVVWCAPDTMTRSRLSACHRHLSDVGPRRLLFHRRTDGSRMLRRVGNKPTSGIRRVLPRRDGVGVCR